jgi:colanic acid/amylovoran biosynthesis glycosyltransferase
MRIAFFTGPFPALSETFILRQISFLRNAGHEVHIYPQEAGCYERLHAKLLPEELRRFVHYPPPVVSNPVFRLFQCIKLVLNNKNPNHLNWRKTLNIKIFKSYALNLRLFLWAWPFTQSDNRFDAIISHFETPANRVAMLRKAGILHGPHFAFFHTSVFLHNQMKNRSMDRDVYFLKRLVFPTANKILPIHSQLAKQFVQAGADQRKVAVFHMGCGEPAQYGERMTPPPLRFLSCCRLVAKKGLDDALAALAAASPNISEWRYDILGDGPLSKELERLAAQLAIRDKVFFHGCVGEHAVQDFLAEAHIFLAPSKIDSSGDREGLPVAILEASAAGIPVISTWHEGIPECVKDGISGILVEEGDILALSNAIISLANNTNLRRQMGEQGANIVKIDFDQTKLNFALQDLFCQCSSEF